jgi:hypothetical protein
MTRAPNIVECMTDPALFQPWFVGEGDSWFGWRVILKAAFAIEMTADETEFFRSVAGDRALPKSRVRELWIVAGRRAGKDSIASLIVAHAAALFDQGDKLRPGERAIAMCLACDREQAKIVLDYTRSCFSDIPLLADAVTRETANGFQLDNKVDVAISTNSFRAVRGRPILCAVFDEVAYWADADSASPDEEVLRAIAPGMATIAGSMLIGISSPYKRSGLLWRKFKDHYGRDGDILVVRAPSLVLNPTLDKSIIDRAMEDDPSAASAEWLGEFRTDIESFVSREAVDAVTVSGRFELPYAAGTRYTAFVDPAGGSGQDSLTLAIAHAEKQGDKNIAVLDCAREWKPPFSPDAVVNEACDLLHDYHVHNVQGDHWGGEFVGERFRKSGIRYDTSDRIKSDIYKELLPLLNSGHVELLEHKKLIAQLCALERKTSRGGRDSIDHPTGAGCHDDVINAVAGALVNASAGKKKVVITEAMVTAAKKQGPYKGLGAYKKRATPCFF